MTWFSELTNRGLAAIGGIGAVLLFTGLHRAWVDQQMLKRLRAIEENTRRKRK